MNDTTLPIKKKRPTQQQPRTKKSLAPGFGLHDWMQLLRHAKDLSQRRGAPIRRSIPLSEIQTHNKPYDGWMILRGKVYNIAPYLAYHPGGSEIMHGCLGRDGTVLFDRYHSWVNLEGLIGPLLLGYVQIEKKSGEDDEEGSGGYLKGKVGDRTNSGASASGDNIVLPSSTSVNTATSSAETTQANVEFAMPKPRPPKGSVVPSLLGVSDGDNDEEMEEELL
eukprot:scaffold3877_cov94-Skeletonema_dohrnii-CCMP3373.AAC.5